MAAMWRAPTASELDPNAANGLRRAAVRSSRRRTGQDGGNLITAEFKNPGWANQALSVRVTGKDIVVNLATNATGALTSTAAQVVAAINANPAASGLVTAAPIAATRARASFRRGRSRALATSSRRPHAYTRGPSR